jgi:hypothetical protein
MAFLPTTLLNGASAAAQIITCSEPFVLNMPSSATAETAPILQVPLQQFSPLPQFFHAAPPPPLATVSFTSTALPPPPTMLLHVQTGGRQRFCYPNFSATFPDDTTSSFEQDCCDFDEVLDSLLKMPTADSTPSTSTADTTDNNNNNNNNNNIDYTYFD